MEILHLRTVCLIYNIWRGKTPSSNFTWSVIHIICPRRNICREQQRQTSILFGIQLSEYYLYSMKNVTKQMGPLNNISSTNLMLIKVIAYVDLLTRFVILAHVYTLTGPCNNKPTRTRHASHDDFPLRCDSSNRIEI